MINLFQPDVGTAELAAVGEVFTSGWLGTGPRVEAFEAAFADRLGRAAHEFQAVTSCTEGLFQVAAALGLGPGDEVVMPTISFIGAAHAFAATGARLKLCDVHPLTLNPSCDQIAQVMTPLTRAIVVLHYGGVPGDVAAIAELARERSVVLIEDAAIGLGSSVHGTACGTFGDVGVWSFDAMKMLTTGDGGMVWCRDDAVTARIRRSTRLATTSGFARRDASAQWWEIEATEIGRRATMNDISAAVGLVQLGRLDASLERRADIAVAYDSAFVDIPWLELAARPDPSNARSFYSLQMPPRIRDRLARHLLYRDIYTSFRYWPLHRTQIYRGQTPFPGADAGAAGTLLVPMHQGLTDVEVGRVIEAVKSFARRG